MIPNLPRELLWTDKKDISEFMSDKLGNDVVTAFSFAKARITTTLGTSSMLKLYNEAFYLSTRVVYERDAETCPEIYMKKILDDLENKELAEYVTLIMFMVLMLQSDKSDEVLQFADKFQKRYLPQMPFRIMKYVNKVLKPRIKEIDFKLKPCPYPAEELKGLSIDWDIITQGFSKKIILEILDLWDCDNEKGKVIRLMERSYTSCVPELNNDELADIADNFFFEQQKVLYNVTKDVLLTNEEKESEFLSNLILDSSCKNQITALIKTKLEGKTKPKDIMRPFRAAYNAQVISRPIWESYKAIYGEKNIKKSSFNSYLGKYCKSLDEEKEYNWLLNKFKEVAGT